MPHGSIRAGSQDGKRKRVGDSETARPVGDFVIERSGMHGELGEELELDSEGREGTSSPDEEADGVAVIDVTDRRDVFNYLTLCADMVQDHLPDQYTKAVALILQQTKSRH